jgi:hypothetical protein
VAAGPPGRHRRRRPGCGRTRGPGMAGEGARGQGAEAKGRSQRHDHEALARSAQAPEREVAPTRGVHLRNPRAVTHPCMVRRLPPHPPKGCMRVPSSSERKAHVDGPPRQRAAFAAATPRVRRWQPVARGWSRPCSESGGVHSAHTRRCATAGPHASSLIVAERSRGVRGPSPGLGSPARQHDGHAGTSLLRVGRVDAPMVGFGYRTDDGESEPRAAAPPRLGQE